MHEPVRAGSQVSNRENPVPSSHSMSFVERENVSHINTNVIGQVNHHKGKCVTRNVPEQDKGAVSSHRPENNVHVMRQDVTSFHNFIHILMTSADDLRNTTEIYCK